MAARTIVLITGGNAGLGYQSVRAMCQSSKAYDIVIGCRSVQKGKDAISALKSEIPSTSSTLSTVQVDIESDESINKAFDQVKSSHGKIDVLINNAGGQFDPDIKAGRLSIREGWNNSWNLNVSGTHVMTHTFMPLLLSSADPRLIFITSGTSSLEETTDPSTLATGLNKSPPKGWPKEPERSLPAYRSAKTGMNMMVREWVRILREDGVKVLCISPGFLATGLGGDPEASKRAGAEDPALGGNFVKQVVEGERDADAGLVMRRNAVQPW